MMALSGPTRQIEVFDPLIGQTFPNFERVDHGFFVIDTVGVEWSSLAPAVADIFRRFDARGFAMVTPWVPGAASGEWCVGACTADLTIPGPPYGATPRYRCGAARTHRRRLVP